jgi:hypothetical protein
MRSRRPALDNIDILEYLVVNLPEQIDVEIVPFKDIAILREPNRFEPLADVAHVASCSRFASSPGKLPKVGPSPPTPRRG